MEDVKVYMVVNLEIEDKDTYLKYFENIENDKDKIFNYMNFDKLKEYN